MKNNGTVVLNMDGTEHISRRDLRNTSDATDKIIQELKETLNNWKPNFKSKEENRMEPEEINKIIHRFLDNCVHEVFETMTFGIDNGFDQPIKSNYQRCKSCKKFGADQLQIPAYHESLDLLNLVEMRLPLSEKKDYSNFLYELAIRKTYYGQKWMRKFELLNCEASMKAHILAEIINK